MAVVPFGLIGCGDISQKRVAPALRDLQNCELVAVSRARPELAESFAKQFGAKRWFGDWRDLIKDDEIQAVYIATPVYLHAEQTIAAAEAGKHVLCEKPMGMNSAECNRMIDACHQNQVTLGVAYYRHFYPVVQRMKALIADNEIGFPVLAQVNAFEWFEPDTAHPRRWLLKKEQSGGGPMFDFGCHRIEVLQDLFGEIEEVKAVSANGFFKREVEDVCNATLKFKKGTCANLAVAHSAHEPRDTFDIYGSRGSLHVTVLNEGSLRVVTPSGERTETHPPAANIHQPLIEDFAAAIIEGRQPIVTGAIGYAVARIEDRIHEEILSQ